MDIFSILMFLYLPWLLFMFAFVVPRARRKQGLTVGYGRLTGRLVRAVWPVLPVLSRGAIVVGLLAAVSFPLKWLVGQDPLADLSMLLLNLYLAAGMICLLALAVVGAGAWCGAQVARPFLRLPMAPVIRCVLNRSMMVFGIVLGFFLSLMFLEYLEMREIEQMNDPRFTVDYSGSEWVLLGSFAVSAVPAGWHFLWGLIRALPKGGEDLTVGERLELVQSKEQTRLQRNLAIAFAGAWLLFVAFQWWKYSTTEMTVEQLAPWH